MNSRYNLRSNKTKNYKNKNKTDNIEDDLIIVEVRPSWSYGYIKSTINTSNYFNNSTINGNITRIPKSIDLKIFDFVFNRDIPLIEVKNTLENVIPVSGEGIIQNNLSISFVKEKYEIPVTYKNETINSPSYPYTGFTDIFSSMENKILSDIMDADEITNTKLVIYSSYLLFFLNFLINFLALINSS